MSTDLIHYRLPGGSAFCPGNEMVLGLINDFGFKSAFGAIRDNSLSY